MTASTVLQSERLELRVPTADDAADCTRLYSSARAEYFGGPFSEGGAWRRFALDLGHWALRGFGMWSVRERTTGTFMGLVGLWYPEGRAEHELGWFVADTAEGRGIAHEAALTARADAYRRLGWSTLVSYIHPQNTRSRALAERLGARIDADAPRGDCDSDLVYRHPSPETAS